MYTYEVIEDNDTYSDMEGDDFGEHIKVDFTTKWIISMTYLFYPDVNIFLSKEVYLCGEYSRVF